MPMKIANDLRWMSSGPRAGLAEIRLPALQPGSSIMPGKVNPVIPEVAVKWPAGHRQRRGDHVRRRAGNFELNVMLPVIAHNLLESIELLATRRTRSSRGASTASTRTSSDAGDRRAGDIIATALNPKIGYDRAAEIVKEARATHKRIRDIVVEQKLLPEKELDKALDVDEADERRGQASDDGRQGQSDSRRGGSAITPGCSTTSPTTFVLDLADPGVGRVPPARPRCASRVA